MAEKYLHSRLADSKYKHHILIRTLSNFLQTWAEKFSINFLDAWERTHEQAKWVRGDRGWLDCVRYTRNDDDVDDVAIFYGVCIVFLIRQADLLSDRHFDINFIASGACLVCRCYFFVLLYEHTIFFLCGLALFGDEWLMIIKTERINYGWLALNFLFCHVTNQNVLLKVLSEWNNGVMRM